MRLFPLLLASTLAIPFAAPAHADCGGGNGSNDPPSNGCNGGNGGGGSWTSKNNQDYSGNNRNNDYSVRDNSYTDNRNQGNDYSDNRNQGNNYGNVGTNAGGGDITNTAKGGKGGTGVGVGIGVGRGGEGGEATIERGAVRNSNTVTGGNQRNVVRGSGNSENTNTNRARGGDQAQSQSNRQSQSQSNSQSQSSSSTSSANNNGNHQNVVIEGDEREVPIAPLPTSDSVGQIGDIVVPLPNVGLGGFTSTQPNGDLDYGVTLGLRIPLGAGSFRGAAEAEMRRRSDRASFRLIQEAVWLRDQGLLTEEAHPRHYAALYGESVSEKFVF